MSEFPQVRTGAATGWDNGPILGYDCETTGVDTENARIVDAALILHKPIPEVPAGFPASSGIVWSKRWLINPGCEIPLEATAVHGISTEHAQAEGISPGQALDELLFLLHQVQAMYGYVPLVVFNAPFDLTILDRELRRNGRPGLALALPVVDPLILDRTLDTYRPGRRTLTAISAFYGVRIRGAHTAEGDVLCSIKLARALAAKYPRIAAASPDMLHDFQRDGYRKWNEHFTEWMRKDDPGFVCGGDWPWMPYECVVTESALQEQT